MTAALSWPLQQALFAKLTNDDALTDLLGGPAIYDAVPHGNSLSAPVLPYILLGEEEVDPWQDKSNGGASILFVIQVHSQRPGFAEAKEIAAGISDALLVGPLSLTRGHLVRLDFDGADFRVTDDGIHRIGELKFRAVIEDTAPSVV